MSPVGLFGRVTREAAIGMLEATGSRDPDVLRARARRAMRGERLRQCLGFVLVVAGALVGLTPLGLRAGLPAAVLGMWLWYRGGRNVAAIEAAYVEFVKTPPR